ncbi:cytochrome b [Vibrio marisflavi]|uniref:Cytochrome b561 n=1 Tax=Vibrio marisflavi CECT 7928 TaxID=634439 RepID=A0ABM9A034_9VIBR|nr:cytochrome b [Vibrio marisflavi]CAH0536799.1 Cytochrome b561 [Vibrio marisflavi CECT 7928]
MQKYPKQQILLHWLTLLLIIVTYGAMDLNFAPKSSPWHDTIKLIHFNAGVLVFLVMFVRVYLYKRNIAPSITPKPPEWQEKISSITHKIIYLCFLALPILGVVSLYIGGKEWSFLGFQMPIVAAPDKATYKTIKDLHETIADAGYFLIALHAGAAIYHHHVVKDDTLKRMMP